MWTWAVFRTAIKMLLIPDYTDHKTFLLWEFFVKIFHSNFNWYDFQLIVLGTNETAICESGNFITSPVSSGGGASDDSECSPCDNGLLCPANAKQAKECNVGGYCEGGEFVNCTAGTYNNLRGSDSVTGCKYCESGWMCPYEKMPSFDHYPSKTGFYIDVTGAISSDEQLSCKPGTYLPTRISTGRVSAVKTDFLRFFQNYLSFLVYCVSFIRTY
jgi:hypothetical protein